MLSLAISLFHRFSLVIFFNLQEVVVDIILYERVILSFRFDKRFDIRFVRGNSRFTFEIKDVFPFRLLDGSASNLWLDLNNGVAELDWIITCLRLIITAPHLHMSALDCRYHLCFMLIGMIVRPSRIYLGLLNLSHFLDKLCILLQH